MDEKKNGKNGRSEFTDVKIVACKDCGMPYETIDACVSIESCSHCNLLEALEAFFLLGMPTVG